MLPSSISNGARSLTSIITSSSRRGVLASGLLKSDDDVADGGE
uniref:Uncharacterized protein n=1 Tax=Arundo donax TaxID=35708 RepID=A0A0A8ZZV0_ARUDO